MHQGNKKPKRQKVEFSLDNLTKNPVLKGQLDGFIQEIELHRNAQKSAAEGIKDIRNEAKDALGIPGKVLNKLVRERMNPGSIDAEVHDLDEIQQLAVGLGMTDGSTP